MVAATNTRTAATALAAIALILLIATGAHAQLMSPTRPPATEQLPNFERSLQGWLTSELALQGVEVSATQTNVSIGWALNTDDRDEIVSQIALVALEAGPAARWAQNLRISPQVGGHPVGVVTVPIDSVRRLANGEIDDEAFLRTWQGKVMPVMADYPADLLSSLAPNQGWTVGAPTSTDGLSVLVEFGLPEVHRRLPENHPAALATVQTDAGQMKVGVIEAGDAATAEALLQAIADRLGVAPPADESATITTPGATPTQIRRHGGLIYIASGPPADTQTAISTLLDPPTDLSLIADTGGDATTGGTATGGTATEAGTPATGGTTTADGTTAGGGQTGEQLLLAESFDGTLANWDVSMVATETADGALYFTAAQQQSLILRQALPMDNIAIEFRGRADTNGVQVYLMKTQNEHYGWALGMGGNQHSMLLDDQSGHALKTVMGAAYTPGQWHTWRLVRQDTKLEAYRDGQPVIASPAAADYSGEGLLVFSTNDARIGLDDLKIYQLPEAAGTQVATGDGQQMTGGQVSANPYESMPLVEDSAVKQAIICLGFDDRSGLRGVQETYPAGTEKVALYMEIEDARPNSEIEMIWQRDGKIIGRQLLLVSGTKKNLAYLYAGGRETLWEGHYAVDIEENDRLVGRVIFTVGNP